ncbi:MAG: T9SS type A sorting domain-containing protein [Saprospiraceae bacterium]|nr:T9SS type A sorting domain-containing protein [Saprospiraceae bacterium]MDW8483071.1 T9SS type A sorting domain-containing protein [Saprospiraceae bacterium]
MKAFILTSFLALMKVALLAQVLDSTFGQPFNSYFTMCCPGYQREDFSSASVFMPNGQIFLAGHSWEGGKSDFSVARLNADGSVDFSFGNFGYQRFDLGFDNDSCQDASLYDANHIIMGGMAVPSGASGHVIVLARITSSGQLDPTFGDGGKVVIDLPSKNEFLQKLIVLPNGRILIGGHAYFGSLASPDSVVVFLGRLFPNGKIDPTFGKSGFTYVRLECPCRISIFGDMVVDRQGRIVLSGATYHPKPYMFDEFGECKHSVMVHRFLSNGQPDPSFANRGESVLLIPGLVTGLHIDAEERIVLGGLTADAPQSHLIFQEYMANFLARLRPDGLLDNTFAQNGFYIHKLKYQGLIFQKVQLLSSRDHYYASFTNEILPSPPAVVMRLNLSGKPDSSFGQNGVFRLRPDLLWFAKDAYLSPTEDALYFSGDGIVATRRLMYIVRIRLNKTTQTEEAALQPDKLRLYPNPMNGAHMLYVEYPEETTPGTAQLRVFDVHGRLAYSQSFIGTPGLHTFDVSALSAGVYVVELQRSEARYVARLVVGQ